MDRMLAHWTGPGRFFHWTSRWWALFLVGSLGALGWAPYHKPLAFCLSVHTLIFLIWVPKGRRRTYFFTGWWWGLGFYATQLFWIGQAFLVEAKKFAWLMPVAILGLPAYLALYSGCLTSFLGYLAQRQNHRPMGFICCFAAAWSLMEMMQGHCLTGFPWTLSAYIWSCQVTIAQHAAILGSYGLGLWTVFFLCLPMVGFLSGFSFRRLWVGYGLLIVFLKGVSLVGQWRMDQHPTAYHENFYMRLVQPFILQKDKMDPHRLSENFAMLLSPSRFKGKKPLTHIIWPETAIPWSITPENISYFPDIHQDCPSGSKWTLISGAIYYQDGKVWNGLVVKKPLQAPFLIGAKQHLVPFSEYIPWRKYLEKAFSPSVLKSITLGGTDFSSWNPRKAIVLPDTPSFVGLICYESIFPGAIRKMPQRPQWILNVSNDGWFGYSPGPYQHLVMAQFRAIEEGLPLVRCTNTGISAVFDGVGRVLHFLPLYTQGIIDFMLPKSISPTLYACYGETLWVISLVVFVLMALIFRKV